MRLLRLAAIAITVAACESIDPSSPSTPAIAQPSPTVNVGPLTCLDLFTSPPYDAFLPVPGISIRAIDKAHFEITNATTRDYYFKVFHWSTEDNLVCGRGVIGRDTANGSVRSGATVQGMGGSAPDIPATVAIWAKPCGDGCTELPLGEYVVPLSAVEPPQPGAT